MDNIILFLMCYHSLILKFETNGFATLFSRDIRFTPRPLPPSSIIVTTSHSLIIVTKWFRFLEAWCCRYWHLGSFANLQLNCLLCFSVCAFFYIQRLYFIQLCSFDSCFGIIRTSVPTFMSIVSNHLIIDTKKPFDLVLSSKGNKLHFY